MADTGKPGDNPQFLFMQKRGKNPFKDGKLTLISPSTVYFSDRPTRMAGHMSNDSFVRLWSAGSDSFQKDPPNAILADFIPNGKPTQTAVILKNPRLEDSNPVYDVSVLKGSLPAESAEAALLIDNVRLPSDQWASCFNLGYMLPQFSCSAR